MKIKFIMLFTVMSILSPIAQADDLSINIHLASKHLSDDGFNEKNYGVGIQRDMEDFSFLIGTYDNSINKQSYYAAFGFEKQNNKYLSSGIDVGLVTGYKENNGNTFIDTPMFYMRPKASIGYKGHYLEIGYVPVVDVVTFSYKIDI